MKLILVTLIYVLGSVAGTNSTNDTDSKNLQKELIIVGGSRAAIGEAPYQCSLQQSRQHFCGCAIISPQWVISAAHCFSGSWLEFDRVEILVGTNDLTSGGTYYRPANIISHETYRSGIFAYDIALVRVNGRIRFNNRVRAIKYSNRMVGEGVRLQTFGWGRLSTNGDIPNLLQKLNLNSISHESCRAYYPSTVHDTHLCTQNPPGQGVCYGDSGSPLVCGNELVGIANFVVPCALGYPDGFARISYLYDWINAQIN